MKLKKFLIIPDTHIPFHDKRAFELMLKVAKDLRPDGIVIMGDFADFYSISSHLKNPNVTSDLRSEVNEVQSALDKLDSLKCKEKYYIEGNHEDRLRRYLSEKAPELFNSFGVEDVLKLGQRGWKFTPYRDFLKIGKMYFTHETGTCGQYAHVRAGQQFEHSVCIGHTHRLAVNYTGNAANEHHVAATCGWLGDRKKVDYMHKISVKKDWQHGFVIGNMTPNGDFFIQPIPIVNYKAVVNGKFYQG